MVRRRPKNALNLGVFLPQKMEDLVSRFAQFARDGILVTEPHPDAEIGRRILWCNPAVTQLTGYDCEELIGHSPGIFFGRETSPEALKTIHENLARTKPFEAEINCFRKDGVEIWCEVSLTPIHDDAGSLQYWLIFMRDVTQRVDLTESLADAQQEARAMQERLWAAIESLPDGFVMYDSEDRLVMSNERYRETYRETGAVIRLGEKFEDILRHGLANGQYPDAVGREEEWLADRLDRHLDPRGPIIQALPDNRFLKIHEVKTRSGDIVGFRVDITELKRQEQELKKQTQALQSTMEELDLASRTDVLTGLGNRRGLDLTLSQLSQRFVPDEPLAFLHFDLDRFKPINDVFGHAAGDHVLTVVSWILSCVARPNDFVARVGGDEFAMLITSAHGELVSDVAQYVASQVIEACGVPIDWEGKKLMFGISIGIALGTVGGVHRMMQDADIALYQAKGAGRGCSALFTPELRKIVERRKTLADEYISGFEEGQLVAYYQPQVDSKSFALRGVEALVRWEHPKHGVMSPPKFLPIVEDLGMTGDLDHAVLLHAMETAHACADAGTPLPKVSVNVSYRRMRMLRDFTELRALQPWPCPLTFELLETIDFDEDSTINGWILDGFRDMGIGIEIDDFGSGRASLTTLLEIRPDRIKIDRRIVSEAASTESGAMAMVRAIGEMARGLGIPMTAEGIETEAQAMIMRNMGCDVLQGYYFGPPMSRKDLLEWLEKPKRRRA